LRIVIVVKNRVSIRIVLSANLSREVNQYKPSSLELICETLEVLNFVIK